jgi:hypothetical protein
MKKFIFGGLMLASIFSSAGILVPVKGQVLRIEKGNAIVKGKRGETHVKMNKVSKTIANLIQNSGSKKVIQFKVAPQAIVGIGEIY